MLSHPICSPQLDRYIYDNEDILLELDGNNQIVARYTHGPGIDEPLIMEKGGQSFFYHADGLGSITEITNQSGTVVQSYTYSSFGKIESQLDPSFVQPYTFTAREFDPETGLYYYRARYYDPVTGRFLRVDPVGVTPLGRGGPNHLYVYTANNPINFVDPSGLISESCRSDCSSGLTACRVLAFAGYLGCNFLLVRGGCALACSPLIEIPPLYIPCMRVCVLSGRVLCATAYAMALAQCSGAYDRCIERCRGDEC